MDKNVIVRLENVCKSFGNVHVLKNINFDIYEGEFVTILGSSGCGKTTILRMISGLDTVTSGKVFINNIDNTYIDPTKREVNTIFQNFALFPKMTVYENVSFGLRMQKVNKAEIDTRVKKIISLVKLNGFEDRYPHELSGGQQQRVAIARGVIMNPKVLLLDESLCSLDLKLKKSMEIELKRIQKKLGITFIYVTHNQEEALSMSDRIILLNKGQIEQIDSPENIYRNPSSIFVADFIGEANIIDATIVSSNSEEVEATILDNEEAVTFKNSDDFKKHENIKLVIRPENVLVSKKESKDSIKGTVIDKTYNGDSTKLLIDVPGKDDIKALVKDENKYTTNDEVYFKFDSSFIIPLRK